MCILQGGYKCEDKRVGARNTRDATRKKRYYYVCLDKRRRQIAKTIPCLPIESNNAGSAFPSD